MFEDMTIKELQEYQVESQLLKSICELLIDYRKRNTLNFQLEKADDYMNAIDVVLKRMQFLETKILNRE